MQIHFSNNILNNREYVPSVFFDKVIGANQIMSNITYNNIYIL